MAEWPSPSGRPTDLEQVCAEAVARHQLVRANLARAKGLMGAVAADDPPGSEITAQFEDLAVFLERHCSREEQILWPAFAALADAARQGQPRPPMPFPTMLHPVRLMESEHERLRERLDHLRQRMEALTPQAEAAAQWRSACDSLATLDAAVADHVRFENEVLYPEALEVERLLG